MGDIKCFNCGEKGHKKFECPKSKKPARSNREVKRIAWANLAEDDAGDSNVVFEEEISIAAECDNLILVDSGANRFVVRDRRRLTNLVEWQPK